MATDSAPQLLQQVLQHMGSREPALGRERQTVASKTELEAAIAAHPWAVDYLREGDAVRFAERSVAAVQEQMTRTMHHWKCWIVSGT